MMHVCVRSSYIALRLAIVLGFLAFLANIAYMYSAFVPNVVCILKEIFILYTLLLVSGNSSGNKSCAF